MPRTAATVLAGLLTMSVGVGACSSSESARTGTTVEAAPVAVEVPDRPEPTAEAGPPVDAVTQVIQEALRTDGNLSYNTLLRRLGAPRTTETETVPNQYVQGQVDTLRTLVYTGLEAWVYDVADDTTSFLVRLSLSSTQYTTPEGVRVGLSEAQVVDEIGVPTRRNASEGELIYQESGSMPTSMVVRVRDGEVVRIDWEFSFA
jgi:hypothetical protein